MFLGHRGINTYIIYAIIPTILKLNYYKFFNILLFGYMQFIIVSFLRILNVFSHLL